MSVWRQFVCISVFLCVGLPSSLAQIPEPSTEEYIEKIFKAQIGELPRMGWFTPTDGFLAMEDGADVLNIYAPIGLPTTGKKKGPISASELKRARHDYQIACETEDSDHLAAFDAGSETEPERALYTTKKLPGETHAGLVTVSLNEAQLAGINRILGWRDQDTLRRDQAIAVRPQSFFYSLHKLYNAKTGLLSQEAIVLHRKDGGIIAHSLAGDLDSGQPCDGCGIPRYVDADSGLYRPLNMFEIPGFAYPVLLLDTSTVEGRALSLLTFTPSGKTTQFRVYEYVVHCG